MHTEGRVCIITVDNRSKKNAYLAARLRALSDDERATLADAADILERLLESGE